MKKHHSKSHTKPGHGTKPPPAPPALNKIEQWAQTFCTQASGKGTLQGLSALGPVNSSHDLLLPAVHANDPQKMLAAEQIIHLVEASRYVAAATAAYISHAQGPATHFAYYAELRAAMSLFAWSGIRLKWGSYFFLDSNGIKQTSGQNPKTHEAVWSLWNEWVKRGDVSALLSNAVRLLPGVSLDRVVKAINFTSPKQALKSWGADLFKISNDHNARNTASYEATWLNLPLTLMKTSEGELVRSLWRLLLSDGSSLEFDPALCSYFVEEAVKATQAERAEAAGQPATDEDLRRNIADHISNNSGAPVDDVLRRLNPSLYALTPFKLASTPDTDAENVLCRAFLLLRIALLAMKTSLAAPSTSPACKKWLTQWLKHAGIWSASDGIDPPDIEIDYRDAVLNLTVAQPLPSSLWSDKNVGRYPQLTRPEACIAWGLI